MPYKPGTKPGSKKKKPKPKKKPCPKKKKPIKYNGETRYA